MIGLHEAIDQIQFVFMPGRGTTNTIVIFRQLQEKYLSKMENLYFAALEKACNRVPRDGVWWGFSKLGVEDWLVKTVQSDNV